MVFDPSKIYFEDVKLIATENLWKSMVKKWEIMGKFFNLPLNAKTVKCNKNFNAKSTNLILESNKSQWQTLPWLVEWLGSPPWLSSLAKWTNKMKKSPSRTLKPAGFFYFPLSRFFPIDPRFLGDFFLKNRQKISKIAIFSPKRFFPKKSVDFLAIFLEKIT